MRPRHHRRVSTSELPVGAQLFQAKPATAGQRPSVQVLAQAASTRCGRQQVTDLALLRLVPRI